MNIIKTNSVLQKEIKRYKSEGKTVGFVPTMGFFHEGHLSLMNIAKEKCDIVVVSLFVNPTQFAPGEDLDIYPRNFEKDEKLAISAGVDMLFCPDLDEIYPKGYLTYIYTEQLSSILCGKFRKEHFQGVTTIVAKLFNIVQPDIAVFGQKDYQQAIIIKRMVRDLNFPIKIILGPIIRERDGIAMSSRNKYLSKDERDQAKIINIALKKAKEEFDSGINDANIIKENIRKKIQTSDLARIEYIEIVNSVNLDSIKRVKSGTFAAVAVYYGKTRLIDNINF